MAGILYRLGAFSARHRVAFVIGWLSLVVWLAAGAVGGVTSIGGSSGQAGEFFKIPGAESSVAYETLTRQFPDVAGSSAAETLMLVLQAPAGELITTPENIDKVLSLVAAAGELEHVAEVANPLNPERPFVSPDQTTAVVTLTLSGVTDGNAGQIEDSVAGLAERARHDGLTALVGGDIRDTEISMFGPVEAIGAGVAFLVLLVALGSLVAAGMNMLTAFIGVGTGVLGAFAYGVLVKPIGQITPALAVMLGLALGIDYGLFIITRFRAELREGRDVVAAAGRAVATAGSSVVFAGCTVITAVAALAVIGIPAITEIGLAAAFAVAVDVLIAVTFIPAALGFVGRWMVTRRERAGTSRREARGRSGPLERWASAVVRFRVPSLVLAVAVLGIVAAPAVSMRTVLNIPGGTDPASPQRAAYDTVVSKFGGVESPLLVLVEGSRVSSALPGVTTALQGLAGAKFVVPGETNAADDVAYLIVIPTGGPNDESTRDLVAGIRSHSGDTAGVRLSVTGETAIGIDSDTQLRRALGVYLGIIVGVCLLLLVVLFRSLLVPLIAAAGFLLSLGAALGASVAIWQWGWGAALPADVGNPLMSFLPILLTGILFGLAMDYQVFLVSRMREAVSRGVAPREAIVDGFVRSGPVVAAAAAIMTFVFGGFGGSETASLASIALALAIGVVADAFLVRMIIVPASLALLGRAAWWLPRWLDRILPHLDPEGRTAPSHVDVPAKEPAFAGERA